MLIGIDASRATDDRATGTEIYSRELIRALLGIDQTNCYRLYTRTKVASDLFGPSSNYEIRAIPFGRLWTHVRLSLEVQMHSPDVLFIPAHVLPLVHPHRSIATIHDLGHLHFPETHPPVQRLYHTWSTRWNANAALHIFADSEVTRDDLIQLLDVPAEKISVVYPAFDAERFRPAPAMAIEKVRSRFRIDGDYILAIGTIHPRKNYARLIEAIGKLVDQRIDLIIVGKRGWLYSSIIAIAQRLGLESRVKFLDYVSESDLPPLISGAQVLAFPSLHEGFGIPVLEAQACGTPVVCSMVSSLPEAAGDAALLFDPLDVGAISGAIDRVLADAALRQKLVSRGYENIKRFSWRTSARAALDVINRI